MRAHRHATLSLGLVVSSLVAIAAGCRDKGGGGAPASTAAPSVDRSPVASVHAATSASTIAPAPRLERFFAAQPLVDRGVEVGVDVGAVARDGSVRRLRLGPDLHLVHDAILASGLRARDDTRVELVGDEGVLVNGTFDPGAADAAPSEAKSGSYLVRPGEPPTAIDADACVTKEGAAWLSRDAHGTRVRYAAGHRGAPIVDSGLIAAALDREVHLGCGDEVVAVTVSDGESLDLARLRPTAAEFTAPQKLVEVERDADFDDELRERAIVVRAGGEVVVVRVGDKSLATRTIGDDGAAKWVRAKGEGGAAVDLDDDAIVIATAAAASAGGPVYVLTSEPSKGTCPGDDAPRRIVLRTLASSGARSTTVAGDAGAAQGEPSTTSRAIAELPCGVEAIAAHLQADGAVARVWWTEPAAADRCAQPGLTVGSVVEASSDRPGARAQTTLAEGAVRVGEGRWLAVTRAGGCAPYASDGAGTLSWITSK